MVHIETQGNPPADVPLTTSVEQIKTQLEPILKCIYAISQLFFTGFTLPKLSLLFLYLRVFVGKPFRIATWATIVIVLGAGTIYSLTEIFSCTPIRYYWDKLIPGKCIHYDKFYRWVNGINVVIDLIILALPLYPLWQLQAPRTRKVGLTIIFLTGGLGMVMSVVRWVQFLTHTSEVIEPRYTAVLITWVAVEPSMYLIACCIAGCGPLFAASKRLVTNKTTFASGQHGIYTHRTNGSAATAGFIQLYDQRSDVHRLVGPKGQYSTSVSAANDPFELGDIGGGGIGVTKDVYVTTTPTRSTRSSRI